MRLYGLSLVLAACFVLAGVPACSDPAGGGGGGKKDAAADTTDDTGTDDTGTADTGTADTGTDDTGTADTGTDDTGTADTGDDPPQVCTPGELFCDEQVLKKCNSAGTAAFFDTDCEAVDLLCQFGQCVEEATDCLGVRSLAWETGKPSPSSVVTFVAVETCEGQPVLGLKDEDFIVHEDGEVVAFSTADTAVLKDAGSVEVFVTVLLDWSGSFETAGAKDAAVEAAKTMVTKLAKDPKVTTWVRISVFAKDVEVWQDYTRDDAVLAARIDDLAASEPKAKTVSIYGALLETIAAGDKTAADRATAMGSGVFTYAQVVLVTAGSDQTGLHTLEEAQSAVSNSSADVVVLALGDDLADGGNIDVAAIDALGKNGAFVAATSEQLAGAAVDALDATLALQKRLYLVAYCSPKLAGQHTVEIEVAGGLGKTPTYELDAATFGDDGPLCSKDVYAAQCDGLDCGGLGCGGCGDLLAQCSAAGQCLCTGDAQCDDAVDCTTDKCDPAAGCSNTPDDSACDDGDQCSDNVCDTSEGCQEVLKDDGTPCDDADNCTVSDACTAGACAGAAKSCTSDDLCGTVACNPDTGACDETPNLGDCDDGDACTTGDTCATGSCAGTTVVCTDTQCSTSTCTQDSGPDCDNVAKGEGLPCDDGLVCTVNDQCSAGECVGEGDDCDDGNPCTDDSCAPEGGCQNLNNTKACDDDDSCTTDDVCGGGACAGAVKTSTDGDVCTADTCNQSTGACENPGISNQPCDDGDVCIPIDMCVNGVCTPAGSPINCVDGKPCTDDLCDPTDGCKNPFNTAACNDGDLCTLSDVCGEGTCAGTPKVCDDGNPCTTDLCNAAGLCQSPPMPEGALCGDKLYCLAGDCAPCPLFNEAVLNTWMDQIGGAEAALTDVVQFPDKSYLGVGWGDSNGWGDGAFFPRVDEDFVLQSLNSIGTSAYYKPKITMADDGTIYLLFGNSQIRTWPGLGPNGYVNSPDGWSFSMGGETASVYFGAFPAGSDLQEHAGMFPVDTGGVWLVGQGYDPANPTEFDSGWLARIATDGTPMWQTTMGPADSYFNDGATISGGGYAVGQTNIPASAQPFVAAAARFDNQGNEVWFKAMPGQENGYFVAAETLGQDLLAAGSVAGQGYLAHFDSDGNVKWEKTLSTPANMAPKLNGMAVDNNFNIFVVGTRRVDPAQPGTEGWVLKLNHEAGAVVYEHGITWPGVAPHKNNKFEFLNVLPTKGDRLMLVGSMDPVGDTQQWPDQNWEGGWMVHMDVKGKTGCGIQ